MNGITLDTGGLIALERADKRMRAVVLAASEARVLISVPAVVIAEWWRGQSARSRLISASVNVEPTTELVARAAGEAIAAVRGATVVDAIVMASAATRGDIVYTSDIDDMQRLQQHFPGVRVLRA